MWKPLSWLNKFMVVDSSIPVPKSFDSDLRLLEILQEYHHPFLDYQFTHLKQDVIRNLFLHLDEYSFRN